MLMVRARRRQDLERHFPDDALASTASADYPWRVTVSRERVSLLLSRQAENIAYHNFKDSVQERDRHEAYLDVWSRMKKFRTANGR